MMSRFPTKALFRAAFFALLLGMNFSASAEPAPPIVYMIGDSTMANKNLANGNPERGWGQLLPEYFSGEVKIDNRAKDGRSTKSFIDEGLWAPVVAALRPGDWVIIQFGHNDQKKDKPQLYADAATDYQTNLRKFITETREKGGLPILATSIYRRNFTPEGKPKSTAGDYPEAARRVAHELDVPLVDLHAKTEVLLASYGEEKAKDLFLFFEPGVLPFYPDGKHDNTHLCEKGAREVCALFIGGLKEQKIDLARWLKETAP